MKEVWLVPGPEKKVEVHQQPAAERFDTGSVHGPGGTLTSTAVPGFTVDLGALFAAWTDGKANATFLRSRERGQRERVTH